jgi:guanylate kinase
LPRQLTPARLPKPAAEIYDAINGPRLVEAGNNALRILEIAQPLRLCPEKFLVPQPTLAELKDARIAEADFPVLKQFLDKVVTDQPVTQEEISVAQEIFVSLGLSLYHKAESGTFDLRIFGDEAEVERSLSDLRKLNIISRLRSRSEKITLHVSDFAAELIDRNALQMTEAEEEELLHNIVALQSGLKEEESTQNINAQLARYYLKLKGIGPNNYQLTTLATLNILSGPSGTGKGTAVQPLLDEGLLKFTFFTCRKRRGPSFSKPEGELYGIDYFFTTERDFQERLLQHGFFAAGYGVHGKHQGVHSKIFDTVIGGHNLYAEMDINLAMQILKRYEANGMDLRTIFMVPPEYHEHLGRTIKRYVDEAEHSSQPVDQADIAKRASNGVGEILTSLTLPPNAIFVVNDVLQQTTDELRTAMGGSLPIHLLDKQENDVRRVSGLLSINKYRAMADERDIKPVDSNMLVLNLHPEAMDRFRAAVVFKLTSPSRTTQDTLVRITNEALYEVQEAVWKSRGLDVQNGKPAGLEPIPKLGIQAGTLSPFHYGHVTASYAGLISAGLNNVVILPGGETTDKPFALASKHREAMVVLALEGKPQILHSPLRIEMAEYFKDVTSVTLGAEKELDRKLAIDLISFNWLMAMNPHVNWSYYLVGVDKVNDYGIAQGKFQVDGTEYNLKGKSERQLVKETLAPRHTGIMYWDRDGLKNIVEEVEPSHSWLQQLIARVRQQGRELFKRCDLPSFNISSTQLRKMLREFDPKIKDALNPRIIDYIYRPLTERPETYTDPSGKTKELVINILQAFILESLALELGRRLKSNSLKPEQLEELQKALDEINLQKKILANQGILADGRALTFEDLKKL